MANSDKLGLGLDDIIRHDRTSNRRGGRGGKQGFRGRAGGRGSGRTNGFQARGGGGLVNIILMIILRFILTQFSLEHPMHQQVVGSTIFTMIIPIEFVVHNERVV